VPRLRNIEKWPALIDYITDAMDKGLTNAEVVQAAMDWREANAPGEKQINPGAVQRYIQDIGGVALRRVRNARAAAAEMLRNSQSFSASRQGALHSQLLHAMLTEALMDPGERVPRDIEQLSRTALSLARGRKLDAETEAKVRQNERERLKDEQRRALAAAVQRGDMEDKAMRRALRALGLDRKPAPEPQA